MTQILNTEKWGCRQIIAGLKAFGVRTVVTSPGSRNVPLLMAASRQGGLQLHSVIDERSAAFIALGYASVSGEPVALLCTSGTAMLNYAPALAEAFYRKIPLIAVTADRPAEWIDQDDSQTIRQHGALGNIVKHSCSIKGEADSETERWFVNRSINDALLAATTGRKGPVHINVAIAAPLSEETYTEKDEPFRKISLLTVPEHLPDDKARELALEMRGKSVLIVAGFTPPSAKLDEAMQRLSKNPGVAVIAEGLANLHCSRVMQASDHVIGRILESGRHKDSGVLRPDILITYGGALVSATLKRMLREMQPAQHWHVGLNEATIDCYMALTRRVEISPDGFFPGVAAALADDGSSRYAGLWRKEFDCIGSAQQHATDMPWSAPLAVRDILHALPTDCNVQLSNGMSVRYAMSCPTSRFNRIDCNRGVSGIDGSISTAVGAAMAYSGMTVLITGDMSMQYDLAALSAPGLPARMKIAVLNNGGGGIFKVVKTTAGLPELPALINGQMNLPLRRLAEAYGIHYFRATSRQELASTLPRFLEPASAPALIEIVSDASTDAEEWVKNL